MGPTSNGIPKNRHYNPEMPHYLRARCGTLEMKKFAVLTDHGGVPGCSGRSADEYTLVTLAATLLSGSGSSLSAGDRLHAIRYPHRTLPIPLDAIRENPDIYDRNHLKWAGREPDARGLCRPHPAIAKVHEAGKAARSSPPGHRGTGSGDSPGYEWTSDYLFTKSLLFCH